MLEAHDSIPWLTDDFRKFEGIVGWGVRNRGETVTPKSGYRVTMMSLMKCLYYQETKGADCADHSKFRKTKATSEDQPYRRYWCKMPSSLFTFVALFLTIILDPEWHGLAEQLGFL